MKKLLLKIFDWIIIKETIDIGNRYYDDNGRVVLIRINDQNWIVLDNGNIPL